MLLNCQGGWIWAKLNEVTLKSELWRKDDRQPLGPPGEVEKADNVPHPAGHLEGLEASFLMFQPQVCHGIAGFSYMQI